MEGLLGSSWRVYLEARGDPVSRLVESVDFPCAPGMGLYLLQRALDYWPLF